MMDLERGKIETGELLAYARQRLNDWCLTWCYAGVFLYKNETDKPIEIGSKDMDYDKFPVTILSSMASFECETYAQVDRAIDLFRRSPPDEEELPKWNVKDEDLFLNNKG